MSNTDFVLTADADFDDLPRTLRRERDVREREKKEREEQTRNERERDRASRELAAGDKDDVPRAFRDSSLKAPRKVDYDADLPGAGTYPAATVKRLEVPFMHLMIFFLKAVVAAIPALILLGAVLWGMGQALKVMFPWLVQMQIYIQFPN